ncbi:unnamed protein product [Chrysoparadoxa australica]
MVTPPEAIETGAATAEAPAGEAAAEEKVERTVLDDDEEGEASESDEEAAPPAAATAPPTGASNKVAPVVKIRGPQPYELLNAKLGEPEELFKPQESLVRDDEALLSGMSFHAGAYVVVETRAEGKPLVFVSDSFTKSTGYSKEDLMGKPVLDAVTKILQVDNPMADEVLKAVEEKAEKSFVGKGMKKDGTVVETVFFVSPLSCASQEEVFYMLVAIEDAAPEDPGLVQSVNLCYRIRTANRCMVPAEGDTGWSIFKPYKKLCALDQKLVDTLQERGEMFCITDPALHDNVIVFVSDQFVVMTGYSREEINGINCRFLQGVATSQLDVDVIRETLVTLKQARVCLLNYRKDGTRFINQFNMSPLRDEDNQLAYFIGVQMDVEDAEIMPLPNMRQTLAQMLAEEEDEECQ